MIWLHTLFTWTAALLAADAMGNERISPAVGFYIVAVLLFDAVRDAYRAEMRARRRAKTKQS